MPSPAFKRSPITLLQASDARTAGLRPFADKGLQRVRPGVYATKAAWARLAPWERYLARVHAYALVSPGSVFFRESAAALRGLPLFGEPREIHVLDPDRARSVRYGDVAVHTSVDTARIEGTIVLTTAIPDTVLALARVLPPAHSLAVVDAALSTRSPERTTVAELQELADSQANRRGRARLRWVFDRADAASESVGESISRAVIEWCGFETPQLQRTFAFEGVTDRVDFFWHRHGIAGESDGYGKYDADDPAKMKAHFVKEKQREDRLRRHLRGFARWDLRDAEQVAPLVDKLLAAGVPFVGPRQHAMLATLRPNPRPAGTRSPSPHRRTDHAQSPR